MIFSPKSFLLDVCLGRGTDFYKMLHTNLKTQTFTKIM